MFRFYFDPYFMSLQKGDVKLATVMGYQTLHFVQLESRSYQLVILQLFKQLLQELLASLVTVIPSECFDSPY